MASFTPLTLAACCSVLASFCGASSSGSAVADLKTDSYLGGALDPSHVFLWTPRRPGFPADVIVEVQNALEELPAELLKLNYGPAECAAAVRKGFETWTLYSGVPMRLSLAMHDSGETVDPELVRIEVFFRRGTGNGLVGYTQLHTLPMQPELVTRVSVEIRIGPDVQNLTGEMVYALLLHEFGHALGIIAPSPRTGHSDRAADVMYPRVRWSELSKNDRLALRELYSLEPTMRRADEVGGGSGPGGGSGSGNPGGGAGSWLRGLLRLGREIASEPASPAVEAFTRCGSCER